MENEWTEIPKYPKYEASREGKILGPRGIMKGTIHNEYIRVTVRNEDGEKDEYVHKLIALTYIENVDNKPTVDHINRDKLDNRVENLRWATMKEQNENKDKCEHKNSRRSVYQLDKNGNIIKKWDSIADAENYLKLPHKGHISAVCKNKIKTYAGYGWKYAIDVDVNEDNEEWFIAKIPKLNPEQHNVIYVTKSGKIKKPNGEIITGTLHRKEYLKVGISIYDNIFETSISSKSISVHKIIANTFLDKVEGKTKVNHKNGIKTDNRLENLEYVTTLENNLHAIEIGLKKPNFNGKNSKAIIRLTMGGQEIETYPSVSEAARVLGLTTSNICAALKGKSKFCYNSLWKYA